MVIWKYGLPLFLSVIEVDMPEGAVVRHVGDQFESLFIWVECDPDRALVTRRFVVIGTGQRVPDGAEYCGTAMAAEGSLVWHVYECVS